jgi:hypothetical protein
MACTKCGFISADARPNWRERRQWDVARRIAIKAALLPALLGKA